MNLNHFFSKQNRPYLIVWVILLFYLGFFIIPALSIYILLPAGFEEQAQIAGNTYHSLTAPFIATVGVFVTFIAFYIQYEANKKQAENFQIQQFENSYFEMLRIHLKNVENLEIEYQDKVYKGKRAMPYFFNQYLTLVETIRKNFEIIEVVSRSNSDNNLKDDKLRILEMRLAFKYFYEGVSNPITLLSDFYKLFESHVIESNVKDFTLSREGKFYDNLFEISNDFFEFYKKDFLSNEKFTAQYGIFFRTYFRHMFQMVKYVDEKEFLTDSKKYEYVKILRSQLTVDELKLLVSNSFTNYGKAWNVKSSFDNMTYLSRYKLLKILTENALMDDFKISLSDYFEDIKFYDDLIVWE